MKKILRFLVHSIPTPENLRVDISGDMKGVPANPNISERLEELMMDIKATDDQIGRYFMAGLLFIFIMLVAVLMELTFLSVCSFLVFLWLSSGANSMFALQQRRFGFVDGIFFVLTDIGKTVGKALEEGRVPDYMVDDIKKALSKEK